MRVASKSLVLLKNDLHASDSALGYLPQKGVVAVTGPFADDVGCWLGDYAAPPKANDRATVYEELIRRIGADRVLPTTDLTHCDSKKLSAVSLVIGVWGGTSERSYQSQFDMKGAALAVPEFGATGGKGVDMANIALPWRQDDDIRQVRQLTQAPLISIVVSGRAQVLTDLMEHSDCVVWAGYAGQYGPRALVDALCGRRPVTGRMPMTLPRDSHSIPVRYNDRASSRNVYKDVQDPVLLPFGFGLGTIDNVMATNAGQGLKTMRSWWQRTLVPRESLCTAY